MPPEKLPKGAIRIKKMTVEIIKGSKRISYAAHRLGAMGLAYRSMLLLPIPTTKDGINVNGTDITLDSLIGGMDGSCVVAGYGLPGEFCERVRALGGVVYDALYDESFQQKNAELTALGAIGELISERDRAPSEVRFGIIGYGRIGSALLKYLSFLGAHPVVFSARESVRLMLGEWGVECSAGEALEDFLGLDVLINTAPRCITDMAGAELLYASGMSIFDLASGENFGGSERVVRLPAVPDRVFPESAGAAYADAICEYLKGISSLK